ncbi:MAG: hypothetical protein IKP00_04405 [Victivallales bacterium]|nr:hypothetical protein [Victivallales bacterium]
MKLNKIAVFALSGLLLAGTAMAQEEAAEESDRPAWLPSLELSLDHTSRYMSEGNVGNPDPINTLSLTAEWGITDNFAFHIGGVSIIDETNACDHDDNVEEWDWLAGITFGLPGGIEVNIDYIYYNYPWDEHKHNVDTKEYEIDVTATELPLSPGIVFVHDFENDVIKANVNVTYEQELSFISDKLGFECPVELWVGNHQYTGSTSHTAVYSVCVQPTLNFAITENISIGTYLQMGWALDSRVRRDWKEDENNCAFNICWGLNLTATF